MKTRTGLTRKCGDDVAKNEVRTAELSHKVLPGVEAGAKAGNASDQCIFATMHFAGVGVPRDDIKAVEWYRKAANQGYAAAQDSLGTMYLAGYGVSKDDMKAMEWYSKAAAQGHERARKTLAELGYDSYDY